MPIYPNAETFYVVMYDLFDEVMANPAVLKPLQAGKVVLRIVTSDPDAILVIDGRTEPPSFVAGEMPRGKVDLGIRIPVDVLHKVWMGQDRMRDAYLGGQMKLDTSPLRALGLLNSLTGLFRYVEELYPGILESHGLN